MGSSSSKAYDVGSKHKGIDGKSSTASRKADSSTLQMKSEVKKNIEATKQRNEDIRTSETATTSKNFDNKVTGNQKISEETGGELSIKKRTLETEETQSVGIRIQLKDDAEMTTKTVEIAQSEEIAPKEEKPETRNENEGIAPLVEELKKEEPEISTEIVETEISTSEESKDERKSQEMREEDIIKEMVRTVNQPKHDENAKSEGHVIVSSVFTAEENYKQISEDDNIINVEVSANAANIHKVEENVNLKEEKENPIEIEDNDRVEVKENQEKLQNETKSDSDVQKVQANEETKKKVRIEIPNENEKMRNSTEPNENDVRVEKKIQIHKPQEAVCENTIEDNSLARKAEEQETIKTGEALQEPVKENKPLASNIHDEETEVDIEVCKIKKEHEENTKDEDNSTQEKVEEQNQPEIDAAVKAQEINLKEDAITGNVQQMEEIRTEKRMLEANEISQEIPKGNTEKDTETINNTVTPGVVEKIPKEEPLSSNHVLSKKESGSGPCQTEALTEVSKGIHPPLQKIQDIEEDTKVLKERIISLTDTDKAEYFALHEALIKNILKLDDLSGETGSDIRSERKRVIKFVQDCLNTLERNVGQPKDSDDSDGEL